MLDLFFKCLFFRGKMCIVVVPHFLSPSDANYRTRAMKSVFYSISEKREIYIVLESLQKSS